VSEAAPADSLLACPDDAVAAWLAAHAADLNLALIDALKRRSDPALLADPQAADAITRRAVLAAERLPHEPLALPLALWARGNWQAYHAPAAAVELYQQALAGYRAAGDELATARLLSNMVFALSDCGRFDQADAAYVEAQAILARLGGHAAPYLLPLAINYGWLLHNQGRYDDALAAHDRALTLAQRYERADKAAEIKVNRTVTLGMLGRLEEGERALLASRAQALRAGHDLTVARIEMTLADLYLAQGRIAEALRRFGAARQQFEALGNQMEVGSVLLYEAGLFERVGALREAQQSYSDAAALFTALAMRPQLGAAIVRRAAVCRQRGAFREATALLDEADALWGALGQAPWQTAVRFERAELALAQGDLVGALDLLRQPLPAPTPAFAAQHALLLARARERLWRAQGDCGARTEAQRAADAALRYARAEGDRWMERHALATLGRLAPPERAAELLAAAAIDDQMRLSLVVEELKAGFQAQAGDVLPALARLAVSRGDAAAALGYAWRAKGAALLDLIDAAGAPPAAHAELERARQELASRRWQLALEADGTTPDAARERRDPAVRALERRVAELRRRRNAARPAAPEAAPTTVLPRLDADELLEYLRCDDELLAIRARRNGRCDAVWLGPLAPLLDALDRVRLAMARALARPGEPRADQAPWECLPLLRRLHDALIAPLGPIAPGARLLIAPCDELHHLPFAALWDGERYLAERCAIEHTPTGALLAAPPPPAADAPPLIIGASAEGRLATVAAEVAAVQAALPGGEASVDDPQALGRLARLERPPRVLHLAAHSVLRSDAPIFSALQLAGGTLSVEQCFELNLAGCELVTLSACATSSGLESGGALLALQSAFFVAGAQRVLSTLWPVDDEATAHGMGQFYRLLAAGLPPAEALRQTQALLRADAAYRHPAHWAAFTCSRR
jgi:tetratricopeptide (TPR) repeat protein